MISQFIINKVMDSEGMDQVEARNEVAAATLAYRDYIKNRDYEKACNIAVDWFGFPQEDVRYFM